MLAQAPEAEFELTYALRLALKTHALTANSTALRDWAAANHATADRVADICLAVPTPAAVDPTGTQSVDIRSRDGTRSRDRDGR